MFVVEGEVVHGKNHTYEITESLCTNSRTIAISCVKKMSAGGDAFVMGNVSVERGNVQSNKKGIRGELSKLFEFVEEVCSVFYKRLRSLHQRFEMVVYKL